MWSASTLTGPRMLSVVSQQGPWHMKPSSLLQASSQQSLHRPHLQPGPLELGPPMFPLSGLQIARAKDRMQAKGRNAVEVPIGGLP